ncbi:MAG: NYN domain-containing protein [Candidatus Tectomicrobia bacterium]|uniref:NYN domain-containing protein n=1 Tax=Tectimicrobiota bacterium TaxID=2528274 RepID=A0A933GNR4_UNCTE|nr:NYN domain-containing protein [Candidatus Tectomicrobia bacterium]
MATRILIDGYNLIAHLWPSLSFTQDDLQEAREKLLNKLVHYQSYKKHQITVVFDAWQGGMPTSRRENYRGIAIVYTKLGETADHFIRKILEQDDRGLVVVTSDRQIADWAKVRKVPVVSSADFAKKMEMAAIMEIRGGEEENYGENTLSTKKKGNPKKLPRSQRQSQSFRKKL